MHRYAFFSQDVHTVERGRLCGTSLKFMIKRWPRPMRITLTCSFEWKTGTFCLCMRTSRYSTVVTVRYFVCVEFSNRLLPPGLLPVLVSLLLICVLVASLVVIFTSPGYLWSCSLDPHLLIRGVVEPCSQCEVYCWLFKAVALSCVFAYCTSSRWPQRAGFCPKIS